MILGLNLDLLIALMADASLRPGGMDSTISIFDALPVSLTSNIIKTFPGSASGSVGSVNPLEVGFSLSTYLGSLNLSFLNSSAFSIVPKRSHA